MPRKALVRHSRLASDLYHFEVLIRVGGGFSAAEEWANKQLDQAYRAETTDGCVWMDNQLNFCLWFRKRPQADVLAHESFHITCSVMRQVGNTLTKASEESFAYLLGWLVNSIKENAK